MSDENKRVSKARRHLTLARIKSLENPSHSLAKTSQSGLASRALTHGSLYGVGNRQAGAIGADDQIDDKAPPAPIGGRGSSVRSPEEVTLWSRSSVRQDHAI
jgi:hypothetical protein